MTTIRGDRPGLPVQIFVDGDTDSPLPVVITNVDAAVTLTGDVAVDTFGALNNAKVTNPDAASATIPALLRGILKAQQDAVALLTTNTTPAP